MTENFQRQGTGVIRLEKTEVDPCVMIVQQICPNKCKIFLKSMKMLPEFVTNVSVYFLFPMRKKDSLIRRVDEIKNGRYNEIDVINFTDGSYILVGI